MTGPLFPENYSKIWIRGRFITMAGVAVRGKLTLAPTVVGGGLVNRSLKLIMSSAAFSADTDNDGYVAVQVPATNDPDITPVNFTYAVTTPIGQKFSIVVPYDTTLLNSVGDPLHGQPVIELIDVVPVGSSGGVGQLLRGIGIQSMVDNGAGGLLITYSDLSTTTIAMPDTVAGPPGPTGPQGPLGPVGPVGPAGGGATKLTDLTDVTTTGAVPGDLLAATQANGAANGFRSALPMFRPQSRPTPPPQSLITAFGSGHGWTNTGGGTVNLNDTTDYGLGEQCITLTTTGGGDTGAARCEISRTGVPVFDATQKAIRVWVKIVSGMANLTSLQAFVGESSSAGYFVNVIEPAGNTSNLHDPATAGWYSVVFDVSSSGQPGGSPTTKSAMAFLRFRVTDNGSGPVTARIGGVALVDRPTVRYPNGVITFGFDDGHKSQFTDARRILDRYGYGATAYVIQDLISLDGSSVNYMSPADLHRLEDLSNWEIAAHSRTVAEHNQLNALSALTDAQLRQNLEPHKEWLLREQFRGADHLAYPQGKYNDATVRVALDYFATARTTGFGWPETAPPPEPGRMRCLPIQHTDTITQLSPLVDRVKACRGWGQFYVHEVKVSPPSGQHTDPTTFAALVDYVAASGVEVRTVSDVLTDSAAWS